MCVCWSNLVKSRILVENWDKGIQKESSCRNTKQSTKSWGFFCHFPLNVASICVGNFYGIDCFLLSAGRGTNIHVCFFCFLVCRISQETCKIFSSQIKHISVSFFQERSPSATDEEAWTVLWIRREGCIKGYPTKSINTSKVIKHASVHSIHPQSNMFERRRRRGVSFCTFAKTCDHQMAPYTIKYMLHRECWDICIQI